MATIDNTVAAKLVKTTASSNYWSPLACLVIEQEEMEIENGHSTNTDMVMTVVTDTCPANRVAAH